MIVVNPIDYTYGSGFEMNGHAEYAEHGQDIVCAGVSAIAQCTAIGLKKYDSAEIFNKGGYMRVHVPGVISPGGQALIYAFKESLTQLMAQYPEHIKIKGVGKIEKKRI